MSDSRDVNNSILQVIKGDITETEADAFVYYARNDLQLGSGFGNAIALRGGPSIRKELENLGPLNITEVAITTAGTMKARHIIHAVGPRFQEADTEDKLKRTIRNVLRVADANGVERIAFPPMGAGFYGVPLDTSVMITIDTIVEYLSSKTDIKEVCVYGNDSREFKPLQDYLKKVSPSGLKKAAA